MLLIRTEKKQWTSEKRRILIWHAQYISDKLVNELAVNQATMKYSCIYLKLMKYKKRYFNTQLQSFFKDLSK